MTSIQDLAGLFRDTNDFQNKKVRLDAEERLRNLELQEQFGMKLLQLIKTHEAGVHVQLLASIYFKNYISRNWPVQDDGHKYIQDRDRYEIKLAIVDMMLDSAPKVKRQISAAITIISGHDFPAEWQDLLPKLVQRLQSADPTLTFGVLEIIESISVRYLNATINRETHDHIRYIMGEFAPKWLELLNTLTSDITKAIPSIKEGGNIEALKYKVRSATLLVTIFFDLNTVDIIDWFENAMDQWARLFLQLLQLEDTRNVLGALDESAGLLEDLRGEVMKVLVLYNKRYEEQYRTHVAAFVSCTCQLVSRLTTAGRYDNLVSQSVAYLTSVVRQHWHRNLFDQEKISLLIEHIVIPNIALRESDLSMYEMEGDLYVRRDLEGSDLETRRRGVSEFIAGLCQNFEELVTELIMQHVNLLIKEYNANNEKFLAKDAAITLVLAVAVKGKTRSDGATILNPKVPVMEFFANVILPPLQQKEQCHALIYSDCIKFLNMFRKHWDDSTFMALLELLVGFLQNEDYVLHTYAAFAIDKVLSLKVTAPDGTRAFRFPTDRLLQCLPQVLEPLMRIVATFPESYNNDYVMRTILRVISRAGAATVNVIDGLLGHMVNVLERICKAPQKPHFNHCVFEVFAASISEICKRDASKATDFELRLCPALFGILENDVIAEFHPYVYQLLGLLLRVRPDVSKEYSDLFDKLLFPGLWSQDGTIRAISGMFGDYMSRVNVSEFITPKRLEGMLGIFQSLLSQRVHDYHAFEVLRSVFEFIPARTLIDNGYMHRILTLCFTRLQNGKNANLCCNFIVCLGVIAVKHDADTLLASMDLVQKGIFGMVLQSVWIPYSRKVTDLIHKRIVAFAMVRMLESETFWTDQNLQGSIPKLFEKCIELFEVAAEAAEKNDYLEDLEAQGFDAKFSRLSYAHAPINDFTTSLGDPREVFLRVVVAKLQNNAGLRQQLKSSVGDSHVSQFNAYCERGATSFRL